MYTDYSSLVPIAWRQRINYGLRMIWGCGIVLSGFGLAKVVNVRTFSSGLGEPAAWIRYGKPINRNDIDTAKNRPDAPERSWVIKRTVYDALWAEYGYACRANNVQLFGE